MVEKKKKDYLVEKKAILGHITRATTWGASYTATQARRRDWVTQKVSLIQRTEEQTRKISISQQTEGKRKKKKKDKNCFLK